MFRHVNGGAFFVRSLGDGDPPLVVTGALTAGAELWHAVTDRFAASRRVVLVDHRGAGRSQASTAGMTLETAVDDLFALLDDLGIERCVHLTESAGCAVAMVAATRQPDRFAGLVLSAPAPFWLLPPDAPDRPDQLDGTTSPPGGMAARMAELVEVTMPELDDPALQRWSAKLMGDDWGALADWHNVSAVNDLRHVVGQVTTPVLTLYGDRDPLGTLEAGPGVSGR